MSTSKNWWVKVPAAREREHEKKKKDRLEQCRHCLDEHFHCQSHPPLHSWILHVAFHCAKSAATASPHVRTKQPSSVVSDFSAPRTSHCLHSPPLPPECHILELHGIYSRSQEEDSGGPVAKGGIQNGLNDAGVSSVALTKVGPSIAQHQASLAPAWLQVVQHQADCCCVLVTLELIKIQWAIFPREWTHCLRGAGCGEFV